MIHNMKAQAVPHWIVQFTKSFFKDWTTRLLIGGYMAQIMQTNTNIPQNSALLLILFLFFACTLLLELQGGTTSAFGFINNSNILMYSKITEENCRALKRVYKVCTAWACQHGVVFVPEKYHLIHFIRSHKKFNMKATVNINGFTEGPVSNLHVLGVQVDLKLKWGLHINIVKTKTATQMAVLTQFTTSTWGTSFQKAKTIYFAVVQLAILYGCSTWYTPPEWTKPKEMSKTKLCQLDAAQNQCLHTIAGAYKSTPIAVLEHETGFLPIQMHLKELVVIYAERTQKGPAREHIKRECNTIQATIAH